MPDPADTELGERVRRMFDELINRRQPDRIGEYFAEDVIDHSLAPGQRPGRDGILAMMRLLLEANPQLRVIVDDVVVQGDHVAARETWHTSAGTWDIAHFFRFLNGRVAEEWSMGWPAPRADEVR